jgi:IS5 family transposase
MIDWLVLCENLRDVGVRPLIKHRRFRPIDHAQNARIDGDRYRQRAMCETIFPTIKRTLCDTVHTRTWR